MGIGVIRLEGDGTPVSSHGAEILVVVFECATEISVARRLRRVDPYCMCQRAHRQVMHAGAKGGDTQ